MSNLLEWLILCLMCLISGAALIVWPLMTFLMWDPLWFVNLGVWSWDTRLFSLLGLSFSGFVFYCIIRYGYKQ
jgi:hypothetical protein